MVVQKPFLKQISGHFLFHYAIIVISVAIVTGKTKQAPDTATSSYV
jgi:hypothetical protein